MVFPVKCNPAMLYQNDTTHTNDYKEPQMFSSSLFLCLVTHLALSQRSLMMYNFFAYFTKPSPMMDGLPHNVSNINIYLLASSLPFIFTFSLVNFFFDLFFLASLLYLLAHSISVSNVSLRSRIDCRLRYFLLIHFAFKLSFLYSPLMMFLLFCKPVFYCA